MANCIQSFSQISYEIGSEVALKMELDSILGGVNNHSDAAIDFGNDLNF